MGCIVDLEAWSIGGKLGSIQACPLALSTRYGSRFQKDGHECVGVLCLEPLGAGLEELWDSLDGLVCTCALENTDRK